MLLRGLETACCHSLMHIDRFLKDADKWQSHSLVTCRLVCMICVVEIGVDESIVVLTIAKHVAWCDSVVVEMLALRTDNHTHTRIHI